MKCLDCIDLYTWIEWL